MQETKVPHIEHFKAFLSPRKVPKFARVGLEDLRLLRHADRPLWAEKSKIFQVSSAQHKGVGKCERLLVVTAK